MSKGSFTVQGATRKNLGDYELTATDGRIKIIGEITLLYCYNNQLTQLDVTKNTELEKLYCYNNQLTQLDVTKNTELTELGCHNNKLTQLDVTKNTALKDLYCYNNQLTQLDVTKNTALEKLYCSNNQLTQLDVTKNTKLEMLVFHENKLTQLDVSQNKNLVDLSVSGNRIDRASMDRLVAQLPNISDLEDEEELGFFVAVDTKNPNEGNYLTQSSAAKAKSKGWKVRDYNNGKDASGEDDWRGIPYEGESGFITMTTSKKVGEEIKLTIKSEGSFTVQGATHKGEGKYELTATDGRITLKGDITHLNCYNNQLTQLDIT
ncbi:leucine-rich repeat domain-containing protein, partial [Porphyromonas gingivicanis]|uniref:leucine-rich repeat domain-containing protein n=1 Tax=Porphyromonas gingivicanis TaxID=266762 RepID=UPI001901F354